MSADLDLVELRRKAEAAKAPNGYGFYSKHYAAYEEAVENPNVVLALIARVEAAEAAQRDTDNAVDAHFRHIVALEAKLKLAIEALERIAKAPGLRCTRTMGSDANGGPTTRSPSPSPITEQANG